MNLGVLFDPIAAIEKKEDFAIKELSWQPPLVALSCTGGVLLATIRAHDHYKRAALLCRAPGTMVILGGRGNQRDFSYVKNRLREMVTFFEDFVNAKDISGRMIGTATKDILRDQYLHEPKALSLEAVLADPFDEINPICVFTFTGEYVAGRNFVLNSSGIHRLSRAFSSFNDMKRYAKKELGGKRHIEFYPFKKSESP